MSTIAALKYRDWPTSYKHQNDYFLDVLVRVGDRIVRKMQHQEKDTGIGPERGIAYICHYQDCASCLKSALNVGLVAVVISQHNRVFCVLNAKTGDILLGDTAQMFVDTLYSA